MICPTLIKSKWPQRYNAPVSPKTGNDLLKHGTGECERVTLLMARSNYTKLGNSVAIIFLGTLVFGGIVLLKGKKNKNEQIIKSKKI